MATKIERIKKIKAAKLKARREYCDFVDEHQEEMTPEEIKALEKLQKNVAKANEAYLKLLKK